MEGLNPCGSIVGWACEYAMNAQRIFLQVEKRRLYAVNKRKEESFAWLPTRIQQQSARLLPVLNRVLSDPRIVSLVEKG
jgi:hypothetical protein